MNTGHYSLRDLKHMCRHAAEVLCEKWGYKIDAFAPADGDEAMSAPPLLQKRFIRGDWMTQIAKGTLLIWVSTSYEYEEYDAYLPTEILAECEFWNGPEAELRLNEMLDQYPMDQVEGMPAR